MILFVFEFEEDCFVAKHVRVLQFLDIDEILAQEQDVLRVQCTDLYCQEFISSLAITFFDDPMGSLPDFLPQLVHVVESILLLVVGFVLAL